MIIKISVSSERIIYFFRHGCCAAKVINGELPDDARLVFATKNLYTSIDTVDLYFESDKEGIDCTLQQALLSPEFPQRLVELIAEGD